MMRRIAWTAALLVLVGAVAAQAGGPKTDGGVRIYVTTGNYEEVRFELQDAIISRGFKIDYIGRIGDMLARTAKDVGARKSVFKRAEYFTFCSARLSRRAIESDARALGFCPYTLFMYELVAEPGKIRVGYRRPALLGSEDTRQALTAVDKLLGRIARSAIQ